MNDATAILLSALERGIREGWEAARKTSVHKQFGAVVENYRTVDDYLAARKK